MAAATRTTPPTTTTTTNGNGNDNGIGNGNTTTTANNKHKHNQQQQQERSDGRRGRAIYDGELWVLQRQQLQEGRTCEHPDGARYGGNWWRQLCNAWKQVLCGSSYATGPRIIRLHFLLILEELLPPKKDNQTSKLPPGRCCERPDRTNCDADLSALQWQQHQQKHSDERSTEAAGTTMATTQPGTAN